jgi:CheY-like chemotaxis protein
MSENKTEAAPVVLVVEDEAILRFVVTDMLEGHGYTVVEAATAVDALKVLETRPEVRVLFTDIEMPGKLTGMDLARLVHEHWPHVMLVITSGGTQPEPSEIPDDGRFIAKPYSPDEVSGEIADLLKKH